MVALDFTKDIILENEVAKLFPMQMEDIDLLTPFSLQEPELWTYSLQPANGLEHLKKYMQKAIKDRALQTAYPFLVFDKQKNRIAGSTRFYDYQKTHNTIQLGYTWYGKDFQGTGLNKNCKFLLLKYAFETLEIERVEFRADHNNKRSIAAMKSIGCTEEGVLRNNCASPNGRRSSIVLSILKSEWEKGVREQLLRKIDFEKKAVKIK